MSDTCFSERTRTAFPGQRSLRWEPQFLFQGKPLWYNRLPFNNRGERAVEIPIVLDFLTRSRRGHGRLLEIGNVLQHYEAALGGLSCLRPRRVIDKFERGEGVENHDLMDLDSGEKYQTIISISTIEHIGQHCTPTGEYGEVLGKTDREAPLKAIARLYDLLDIGGHALVTVPFGKLTDGAWYIQFSTHYLDLLVTHYGIPREALVFSYLKQISREKKWSNPHQHWIETTADALEETCYDVFWSGARAIAILELTKLPQPFTLNVALPPTPLLYAPPSLISRFLLLFGRLRRSVC
jgi:hypothetical protein